MAGKSGSAAGKRPARALPPGADGPGPARSRAWIVAGISVAAVAVLAFVGWSIWGLLGTSSQPAPDLDELRRLETSLTSIEDGLRPIAESFTSQPETAPIDITEYHDRIGEVRVLVQSVNDLQTTSPEALEIRDEILTGGTQVLDGMESALGALASDDASATEGASVQVEEGLTQLDDARTKLRELLGTTTKS